MSKKKPRENQSDGAKSLNTFLLNAISEGALGVRFEFKDEPNPKPKPLRDTFRGRAENVVVSYYVGGEWKVQRKTVDCGHADLLAEVRRRAAMSETDNIGRFALDLYGENGDLHLGSQATIEIPSTNVFTLYLVTSSRT